MATKIIAVAGRKSAGKTSLCLYIQAYLWRRKHPIFTFQQNLDGSIAWEDDAVPNFGSLSKVYSFADSLKEMCINVLGLSKEQVWGSEADKNSLTRFEWDNLPEFVRWVNYPRDISKDGDTHPYPKEDSYLGWRSNGGWKPQAIRHGFMTAREVMQVVGTDIMRKMFWDGVWVNATLNRIKQDGYEVALVGDARFVSEFHAVHDVGGYVIRLERDVYHDNHASEVDFYNFDFKKYPRTLVIPAHCDIHEKNHIAMRWLENTVLDKTNG